MPVPLPDSPVVARFAAELAQDQGWSPRYTRRVLTEYRRLLILSATSGERILGLGDAGAAMQAHHALAPDDFSPLCVALVGYPLTQDAPPVATDEVERLTERTLALYHQSYAASPSLAVLRRDPSLVELSPWQARGVGWLTWGVFTAFALLPVGGIIVNLLNPLQHRAPSDIGIYLLAMLLMLVAAVWISWKLSAPKRPDHAVTTQPPFIAPPVAITRTSAYPVLSITLQTVRLFGLPVLRCLLALIPAVIVDLAGGDLIWVYGLVMLGDGSVLAAPWRATSEA